MMNNINNNGELVNKKRKSNRSVMMMILFGILIVYTISLFAPFIWSLLTTFKSDIDFLTNPFGLPEKFEFSNYKYMFNQFYVPIKNDTVRVSFFQLMLNSLIFSLGSSFLATLTPCIVAYALAKFDFKFSKIMYSVILVVMMLPIIGSLPSEINMARSLGIYNTFFGAFVMKSHFISVYFMVFYGVFKGIPKDYYEAAYIDGANNWYIMFKIALPLIKYTFMTIMLLNFISFWNDFNYALIYLPDHPTLSVGLFLVDARNDNNITVPLRLAGSMIALLPILIIFLFSHKKLIGNITMGGVKG